MTERAARLVDGVLPGARAPVGAEPAVPASVLLAWDRGLARAVLAVSVRVLLGFQRHRTRRDGIRDWRSGPVTVNQRFGGGLNLNVHFHTLLLDGVFFEDQEGALEFRPLPPPTDDEVGGELARIAARVQRLLRRRGCDPWEADGVQAGPLVDESPTLGGLSNASVQGRMALGRHAGARVWRLGGRSRRSVGALDDAAARAPGRFRSSCAAICFDRQWRRTGSGNSTTAAWCSRGRARRRMGRASCSSSRSRYWRS
jgi:hypothetical protein